MAGGSAAPEFYLGPHLAGGAVGGLRCVYRCRNRDHVFPGSECEAALFPHTDRRDFRCSRLALIVVWLRGLLPAIRKLQPYLWRAGRGNRPDDLALLELVRNSAGC